MEGILKNIKLFAKEKEDREAMEQYRGLLRDLELLRAQIERVDSNFNMTTDEDLVESYIYESNALAARYRFLLREGKGTKIPFGKPGIPRRDNGVMKNADMGCMLPGNFDVYFVCKNGKAGSLPSDQYHRWWA